MRFPTLLLAALALTVQGCALLSPAKKPAAKPEGFGTSRAGDLVITCARTSADLEWDVPADLPVEVSWTAGQKYAVRLAPAADTPPWLKVEVQPSIIEPPGTITVRLTAVLGEAPLGTPHTLTLEGLAYGLGQPVTAAIPVTVRRRTGEFTPLLAAPVTVECSNICGKVANGAVTFYDVLKEKNQTCSDAAALPETQRIGSRGFPISSGGFGFGRTCRVAAVYETTTSLTFVNLGLTARVQRGAMMLSLRGVNDCWLSPDNTVALIKMSDALIPYDVLTSQVLGSPCRAPGAGMAAFLSGTSLTSGSCSWEIK
jgi:hypothetical protein